MERRLAAILVADIVGYSRLMGGDETGMLARLKSLHAELVEPQIIAHKGRVVKLMGDGVLAEFPSVVGAVQCAVDIQRDMPAREAGVPDHQQIRLRIGINLGDIIVEGVDIFGSGVNVAARLEALAEPGCVCVSGTVFDHVKDKVDLSFADLGEHEVKNIDQPVQVYRISLDGPARGGERDAGVSSGGSATQQPSKPRIAVLPFDNMSGDPEQEYFSDGITEDIITELSRFKNLFVVARNSTFVFKGQAVDVGTISARLGVGYVVEGSVRKAGNRVRVTAQLVEAKTGNHIWAERYDRDLEDIFAVQDELVSEIAATVPGQLDSATLQRTRRRPAENLTAYEHVLRGDWLLYQDYGSREARALYDEAIALDPRCARAYTRLAAIHAYSVFAHGAALEEAAETARSLAETALDLDPTDPAVQATVAEAYILVGEHDLARHHIEKAIRLNPNEYVVMHFAGLVLGYLGQHEEALRWLHKNSRHDPFSGESLREKYFDISYMARRYEDAIGFFKGWRNPPPHMHCQLAAAYAQLDRMTEAQAAMANYEQTRPPDLDTVALMTLQARMCAHKEDGDHWLEGYRKAGLDI